MFLWLILSKYINTKPGVAKNSLLSKAIVRNYHDYQNNVKLKILQYYKEWSVKILLIKGHSYCVGPAVYAYFEKSPPIFIYDLFYP